MNKKILIRPLKHATHINIKIDSHLHHAQCLFLLLHHDFFPSLYSHSPIENKQHLKEVEIIATRGTRSHHS